MQTTTTPTPVLPIPSRPPRHTPADLRPADVPTSGFLRLPGVLRVIPVSKSTWWSWIKRGIAPAGVKLSERVTCWRVEDILALIARLGTEAPGKTATTCQCPGGCACSNRA